MSSGYRLAPALAARVVGLALVGSAVVLLVATLLTVVFAGPVWVVPLAAVSALALTGVLAVLTRRLPVLGTDAAGYRIHWVRGAGASSATWRDVTEAVAASPGGVDCVVLRLRDGRTTTLPVDALAVDRGTFVAEIREHLTRGEGLRPL